MTTIIKHGHGIRSKRYKLVFDEYAAKNISCTSCHLQIECGTIKNNRCLEFNPKGNNKPVGHWELVKHNELVNEN